MVTVLQHGGLSESMYFFHVSITAVVSRSHQTYSPVAAVKLVDIKLRNCCIWPMTWWQLQPEGNVVGEGGFNVGWVSPWK